MSALVADIRQRLVQVEDRIARAAARAGRDPAEVSIVAVTKLHPAAMVLAARGAGIRCVGENYAQELVQKLAEVADSGDLEWHFIGKLQRNKAKSLVGRVALIHAVDSVELGREIDRRMARYIAETGAGDMAQRIVDTAPAYPHAGTQRVLVAVNVGGEAQKSGARPDEARELVAALAELPHVECVGLMTMPPLAREAEDSRPHFRALRELRDALRTERRPLPILSMGTSDDFEVAVEEGATLVRLGTVLLGSRPT